MRAIVTGSLCLPGKRARGMLSRSRMVCRPVLVHARRLAQQAGKKSLNKVFKQTAFASKERKSILVVVVR